MIAKYIFNDIKEKGYSIRTYVAATMHGKRNDNYDQIFDFSLKASIYNDDSLQTLYAELKYPIYASKCKTMIRSDYRFMKSWSFDVSNNNISFTTLHNGSDLCDSTIQKEGGVYCSTQSIKEFEFEPHLFKYFRIRATDKDTWDKYGFTLQGFDIFGIMNRYCRNTCLIQRKTIFNPLFMIYILS